MLWKSGEESNQVARPAPTRWSQAGNLSWCLGSEMIESMNIQVKPQPNTKQNRNQMYHRSCSGDNTFHRKGAFFVLELYNRKDRLILMQYDSWILINVVEFWYHQRINSLLIPCYAHILHNLDISPQMRHPISAERKTICWLIFPDLSRLFPAPKYFTLNAR